jgi:hypothetical protein
MNYVRKSREIWGKSSTSGRVLEPVRGSDLDCSRGLYLNLRGNAKIGEVRGSERIVGDPYKGGRVNQVGKDKSASPHGLTCRKGAMRVLSFLICAEFSQFAKKYPNYSYWIHVAVLLRPVKESLPQTEECRRNS